MTKLINNILRAIFACIVTFLLVASIFSTCNIIKGETTTYESDNFILNIFFIILTIGLAVIIKNKNMGGILKLKEKNKKKIILLITIIWILIAFVWIAGTELRPRADQKKIYRAALDMSEENYESFNTKKGYINSNPQQIGMVLFEYILSLITTKYMGILVQILNVFALLLSFYVIYKITNIMFENKRIATIAYLGLLAHFPIFLYITFMYGNIFGLCFSMLAVLFEIKYFEKNKWYYIVISAISIAIAVVFKSNYLITLIAMVVMYIIKLIEKHKLKNVIAIMAILLIYIFINSSIKICINKLTGSEIEDGIPMSTYIAMGMQEGNMAPGWYNGYNRSVYKENNYDYEQANEASIEYIKERLKFFIQNPKYTIEFYGKKILSQWNNPTFQCFWVNKSRSSKIEKPDFVKSILGTGETNKILTEYVDIIQTLILFGAMVFIIIDYKNTKGDKLFLIVIFIGGFLFHIIWEAKCQYTITYFILLIPYCVKGYDLLAGKIESKWRKRGGTIRL